MEEKRAYIRCIDKPVDFKILVAMNFMRSVIFNCSAAVLICRRNSESFLKALYSLYPKGNVSSYEYRPIIPRGFMEIRYDF